MTELRKRFIDDLTLAGYSANTRRTYVNCLALLAKHYMMPPDKLSIEELKKFILYRINESKLSSSYIRSTILSIELFYTLTNYTSNLILTKYRLNYEVAFGKKRKLFIFFDFFIKHTISVIIIKYKYGRKPC